MHTNALSVVVALAAYLVSHSRSVAAVTFKRELKSGVYKRVGTHCHNPKS